MRAEAAKVISELDVIVDIKEGNETSPAASSHSRSRGPLLRVLRDGAGPSLVSVYPGTKLDDRKAVAFDEFQFPVAKMWANKFTKELPLEGKLEHLKYRNPEERSTLELFRNYETSLKQSGFSDHLQLQQGRNAAAATPGRRWATSPRPTIRASSRPSSRARRAMSMWRSISPDTTKTPGLRSSRSSLWMRPCPAEAHPLPRPSGRAAHAQRGGRPLRAPSVLRPPRRRQAGDDGRG